MVKVKSSDGTIFDLDELGEVTYSLLAPEGVECDDVEWPTTEECSAAVGMEVRFLDAGDHPTRCEAILIAVRNDE